MKIKMKMKMKMKNVREQIATKKISDFRLIAQVWCRCATSGFQAATENQRERLGPPGSSGLPFAPLKSGSIYTFSATQKNGGQLGPDCDGNKSQKKSAFRILSRMRPIHA